MSVDVMPDHEPSAEAAFSPELEQRISSFVDCIDDLIERPDQPFSFNPIVMEDASTDEAQQVRASVIGRLADKFNFESLEQHLDTMGDEWNTVLRREAARPDAPEGAGMMRVEPWMKTLLRLANPQQTTLVREGTMRFAPLAIERGIEFRLLEADIPYMRRQEDGSTAPARARIMFYSGVPIKL